MPKDHILSVLVDTSFLISLYGKDRANHRTARKYFEKFIENSVEMMLSTIVISEYQQMQPIVGIISSKNYIILPYNYQDAIATAEIAYNITGEMRGSTRAEFKDDLKLMGQAKAENISFVITDDESTLAKYCKKLSAAGMFSPKVIILKDGFDDSYFNQGQASLIEQQFN